MLPVEYRAVPLQFLIRFFEDYKLGELVDFQCKILENCMTSDNPPFTDPGERQDLIHYTKNVHQLFEAAFLLVQQSKSPLID